MLRTRLLRFYSLLLAGFALAFGIPLLACAAQGGATTGGSRATSVPRPHASAADFVGRWVSEDATGSHLTRLIITTHGQTLSIHGYGACSPTDCDWGTVSGPFTSEPYVSTFAFDGSRADACCRGASTLTLKLSFVVGDHSRLEAVSQDAVGVIITHLLRGDDDMVASDFVGTWYNIGPYNPYMGIGTWVQVVISLQGNTLTAHFYQVCYDGSTCDLGSASTSFEYNPVYLTLTVRDGTQRNMTLLRTEGVLEVTTVKGIAGMPITTHDVFEQ